MKPRLAVFLLLLVISVSCFQEAAFAACASPSGNAGGMIYNSDYSVYQYCDGTKWIAMGPVVTGVSSGITNGQNAVDELGQFASTTVDTTLNWTQSASINNAGAMNALGMWQPYDVKIDAVHHYLYVADGDTRVMVYALNADNSLPTASGGHSATYVIGQANMTTEASDITANRFNSAAGIAPGGMAVDTVNQRLFVTDPYNVRVMVFDTSHLATNMSAGVPYTATAHGLLGAPAFNTTNSDGTTATQFANNSGNGGPSGLAYDSANTNLYVTDPENNRVMIFSVPTGFTNGEAAANEFGQPSGGTAFTTSASAHTQSGMYRPTSLAYDSVNQRLFVADSANNRVLVFSTSSLSNGPNAIAVIGQASWTANGAGSGQTGFGEPNGLAYDSATGRLFVVDVDNNRVLIFDAKPADLPTFGASAIGVLGQTNYTNSAAATTQSGLAPYVHNVDTYPTAQSPDYDPTTGRLYVPDGNNNRIMIFDVSGADTGSGLVGWWKLDDGTSGSTPTSAADSSGNGNNGSLYNYGGNPTWTTSGQIGNALTVTSTGNGVEVPDAASLRLGSSLTASMWVKITAWPASGHNDYLLSKFDSSDGGGINYALELDNGWNESNPPMYWEFYMQQSPANGSGWCAAEMDASSASLNTWYLLTGVYDSSTNKMSVYLNGALGGTINANTDCGDIPWGSSGSGAPLSFGMNTYQDNGLSSAVLDDVRVYSRGLSAAEVAALYSASTGGSSGCTSPSGSAGALMYNSDYHVFQYCSGTKWIAMGPVSNPCTATPGTVCADGTVYAGLSTNGNVPMFAEHCDYGMTWSGSACTGSRTDKMFSATSYTTGVTNADTGKANTAALVALVGHGTYPAASACDTLSEDGYSDWYLPAVNELHVLYVNQTAIGNFDAVVNDLYESSTDDASANYNFLPVGFSNGDESAVPKNTVNHVRCVRTGGSGSSSLTSGLVGWWKLDDGSSGTTPTTAADSSGSGDTLALTGSPVWTSSGEISNALTFSGTSQKAATATLTNIPATNSPLSMSVWFKYASTSDNASGSGLFMLANLSSNLGIDIQLVCCSGDLRVLTYGGTSLDTPGITPTAGVWHQVVYTWNGTNNVMYIDGAQVATSTTAPDAATATNLYIGADTSKTFTGTVDDARVYNRALSAAEVAALYNTEGAMFYNSGSHIMQYFNGTNWVGVGYAH